MPYLSDERRNVINDATKLMLHCAGYLSDGIDRSNKWRLSYALDTDVVKLYMAPRKRLQYATVFSDDSEETRVLLANLISNSIFPRAEQKLSNVTTSTYLLIPPHDLELMLIVLGMSTELVNVADQLSNIPDDVLIPIRAHIQHKTSGAAQVLLDCAQYIVELFDRVAGLDTEIRRYIALGDERLLNIERYTESKPDGQPSWAFPLPRPENAEDTEELTRYFAAWKMRLQQKRTKEQKFQAIIQDAHVLATLEFVNKRLVAEERKLILITGARPIIEAAIGYEVSWGDDSGATKSFRDLYIRHPQSFIANPAFFEPRAGISDNNFNVVDWLNLFFPRFVDADLPTNTGPFIDVDRLRLAREAVQASFRDIVEGGGGLIQYNSLLGEWKEQIKNTSIARDLYSTSPSRMSTANALAARLTKIMHETVSLDDIRHQLAASALRSLETLYSSAAWLGLFSQLKVLRERVRGIPALRFDKNYPAASTYCQKIITAMRASNDAVPRPIDAIVDLKAMDALLSKEDKSNYHTLVIHGLAFATKGHWYAARTLCQLAIKITDFMPEEQQNGRRGREAAYLLAVASRRLASSRIDLDEAERTLKDAENRETAGVSKDCRFVSEDVAIRAARLNFDVFLPLGTSQDLSGPTETHRIAATVATIFDLSKVARTLAEKDDEERISRWVLQQLVVNVLGTALACHRFGIPIESRAESLVREFLRIGEDISGRPAEQRHNWDDVCKLVYLTAYVVFGRDQVFRDAASRELDSMTFEPYSPFDIERERRFREMVRMSVRQKPR